MNSYPCKEACVGCEACVDRCHMDAITVDEIAVVNPDRCIGCGVCVPSYPTEAMVLAKEEIVDQYEPPESVFETYFAMAKERRGEIFKVIN
jgi:electron transport complex protein RnfB